MLNMNIRKIAVVLAAVLALGTLTACGAGSGPDSSSSGGTIELTNVSYDPTRELYAAYNEIFEQHSRLHSLTVVPESRHLRYRTASKQMW